MNRATVPVGPRVRAPELAGGDWLGTGAEPRLADTPSLAALRGRFVLLDFWTAGCGNCLHVLDELRVVEDGLDDVLTVVGVHSPKFPHEAALGAVAAAIARNDVRHPVRNDPDLALWRQYAVHAWPTLVLIDPEGYVVAQAAGEGQVAALAATVRALEGRYEQRGTLRRGATRPAPEPAAAGTTLRFPAKAIALPAARTGRDHDTVLVADAGGHRLVELDTDLETVLARFGSGRRGEPFAEPNGLALLPPGLAPFDVVVADTANHRLVTLRLVDGELGEIDLVAGLAGTRTVTGPVPSVLSPWDVAWWPAIGRLVVAAAGVHLLLAVDPRDGAVEILAGTTVEGLRDGPGTDAWLAQPSALAADGDRLWFVDAESSSVRRIDADGMVQTLVGEGLFDFGHVDGPPDVARLQHPLGIAVLPDGSLAVADTYNGALRRVDPSTGTVETLARGLAEPSGVLVVDGAPVVVESAADRLVRPDPAGEAVALAPMRTDRPVTAVAAGRVPLRVLFTPAPGRELDEREGPATRLIVTASPAELLRAGAGGSAGLERDLELAPGEGTLHITAQAASCDADPDEPHPACHLARQDWGIPVRIDKGAGAGRLDLTLLG